LMKTQDLEAKVPILSKCHPWFDVVDWERVAHCSFPVPHEITSQITQHLESHSEDCTPVVSLAQDVEDLNIPEWLDDW
ncbi:protein phosphatase 2C and cyclic nucleotide-binding/kinase domain-containing protein isoform X1, partial [Fagus crenata]